MRIGGKLMTALRLSGDKKLEGLWRQQKQKQIEDREVRKVVSK